jgi:hypothetical protein
LRSAAFSRVASTALAACATTTMPHVLVQLRAPWPTAVGELSSAAARAVREDPTRSAVTFGCSSEEWRRLQQAGAGAHLIAADLSSYYAARAHADGRRLASSPSSSLSDEDPPLRGSVGGFFSAAEAVQELRRLTRRYPAWVGNVTTVGTTRQGRPIHLLCVTRGGEGCDGPSERPAVLYTALLHGREPVSLACLLHFLRTTLRQAEAGEPGAAALLSRRKLLFLPTVLPPVHRPPCTTATATTPPPPWPSPSPPPPTAPTAAPAPSAGQPRRVGVERGGAAARRRHEAQERPAQLRARRARRPE